MNLHRRNAKEALIGSLPLFADCSATDIAEVARLADEIDLPTGRVLTTEGTSGRELMILVAGRAVVRKHDEDVATLGPGDLIGEIAMVTEEPRTATVVTTEPARVLVLPRHHVQQLLAKGPIRDRVERTAADRLSD
ncbi:cyclic nucleotide-binding domain-containing protein [Nocardioides limicola]|uniref:cyclic nucleotide-binding domain-containing protein n=1 Tax=Nocardioides limicola TaxID=2803368 RepID=UPI00193C5214|nr:cyclic nucleotide-binding domain-containing protein [Nocardioides sp. DJM-14]